MPLESQCNGATAFDQAITAAVSRELHRTAQPLTILQGLLELMLSSVSTAEECKSSLERAIEEVHRLTSCFDDVRKLVGLQRSASDIGSVPLSMLVADVLQNLRSQLDIAGIAVVFNTQPNEKSMNVAVNVSHSRVFNAVRLVLVTLVDCLHTGDQIKISIGRNDSNATIVFWPLRHSQPGVIEEQYLLLSARISRLEFAQVLFSSVGGEVHLNETSGVVVMSLPAAASQPATQDRQRRAMHV